MSLSLNCTLFHWLLIPSLLMNMKDTRCSWWNVNSKVSEAKPKEGLKSFPVKYIVIDFGSWYLMALTGPKLTFWWVQSRSLPFWSWASKLASLSWCVLGHVLAIFPGIQFHASVLSFCGGTNQSQWHWTLEGNSLASEVLGPLVDRVQWLDTCPGVFGYVCMITQCLSNLVLFDFHREVGPKV